MLKYCVFIMGLLGCIDTFAQSHNITGKVVDSADTLGLPGVYVIATPATDSTKTYGGATDMDGAFSVSVPESGSYKLKISFIGYKDIIRDILVSDADITLGTFRLEVSAIALKGATIEGQKDPVEQRGDTTQYNSSAFKTNKDATAEDLIQKMPGVTSENGTTKVNGEQIQTVLVDGKPFFGDDPSLALKNLPAEVIDKVQVFDRQSDQSKFTGFDDGSSQKTMNIITKKGRNDGIFGRVYGGLGHGTQPGDEYRYGAGGSLNYFKGDRRISVLELSNNINQQNFSSQDLLGITSSAGSGGGAGRGGRGGGGASNNFLVGNSGGIATTHAAGFNYSDMWGKKIKVTGSYFFNYSNNITTNTLTRNYISPAQLGLVYNENSETNTKNYNHRVNLRLEYNIDSNNTLIFTPKVSFQKNNSVSTLQGANILSGEEQSNTLNRNTGDRNGYNFGSNLLYQHKFKKAGRTIAFSVGNSATANDGNSNLYSLNAYLDTAINTLVDTIIDQRTDNNTHTWGVNGNLTYTEPIGKISQLQISYAPSFSRNITDKLTNNLNTTTQEYSLLDTSLSNKFNNDYITQRGGLSYRINYKIMNLSFGADYQYAQLQGEETYPYQYNVDKVFQNALPQLRLELKFNKTTNLNFNYRTNTNAPSIGQLQNVINNNNTLLLSTGNPDLKQDFQNNFMMRVGGANTTKASNIQFFAGGSYYKDYIGTSAIIPVNDTIVNLNGTDSVLLKANTQLTRPVNLDGYANARAFFTYGKLISKIKLNVNVNTGFNWNRIPGLVNDQLNLANNYSINQGIVLSSNISEKIDFTVSYNASYTIARNSLQSSSNSNYFNHTASAKFNYQFWKGFVFNTAITNTFYKGLSATYDRSYFLWNLSLGYKFLKDESLEVKASIYDILAQNNSIGRNITETYIEDTRSNVLTRYAMLTVTYTFKKFKNAVGAVPKEEESPWKGNRPEGGRPPGGGGPGGGGPGGPP